MASNKKSIFRGGLRNYLVSGVWCLVPAAAADGKTYAIDNFYI
jgi:hypothetical protein